MGLGFRVLLLRPGGPSFIWKTAGGKEVRGGVVGEPMILIQRLQEEVDFETWKLQIC